MTELFYIGVFVLGFALGFGNMPKLAVRKAKKERDTFERLTQDLTKQLRRTLADLEDQARRAEEYRVAIESCLKQRDTWQNLYDQQSVEHGNAQAMMMGVIEHQERKLQQAGITVALPPVIQEIRGAFIEHHVTPVLQRTAPTSAPTGEDRAKPLPGAV